jgi:hypothetical protein
VARVPRIGEVDRAAERVTVLGSGVVRTGRTRPRFIASFAQVLA